MTSRSTRSDSGSDKPVKQQVWRLSRTLKRKNDFRPIETDDLPYLWAAYRKGALSPLGSPFDKEGLSVEQFREMVVRLVSEAVHATWILFAPTMRKVEPVGVVFGMWGPGEAYMIVNGMCWFPWASVRNQLEAIINFLNGVRGETSLMFFASLDHKRMYEVCMMHGIIRRIGTSYVVSRGEPMTVFETRPK